MGKNNLLKYSMSSVVSIIVLIAYSLIIIMSDPYLRLSADSTLYISIAEKYLRGDFNDAVNGYWGPMLSWLIIPFLYFGFSHVFAINAIYLFSGVFAVIGVRALSLRFEMTDNIRSITMLCMLPIILYYSITQPFDLILLCFLVCYLSIVFKSSYSEKVSNGIFSGILGSFAYLTKSYAFPFFILHFLSMNLLHLLRYKNKVEKKKVLRNALAGFILFALISGAWIIPLSSKYGHFTFSNMGKTNLAIMAPGAPEGTLEFGQPMFYKGFFDPPNKTAIVAWEDPSYIEVKTWSPFESWSNLKHFMRIILKNISQSLLIYESFSTLSIVIIIAYILLLCSQPFNKIFLQSDLFYPLFTVFLYTGGYLFFHLEARYIWIVNILLLLMGGHILNVMLSKEFFKNNTRKNLLILLFIGSFIFIPSKKTIQSTRDNFERDMHVMSTNLEKYNIKGNIASSREHVPVHDSWHKTFRLAYWLGGRYYGQAKDMISDKELESDLKEHNIEYYFQWGESGDNSGFLSQFKELTNDEIPGLKIYSLKENAIKLP